MPRHIGGELGRAADRQMKGRRPACAITMVRDDHFFLERWVAYYSQFFGRDALYVINHGGDAKIADIAWGCNVINLPPVFDQNFDAVRWRLIQNLANGLRGYFEFIICGDVDEFVVVDPSTGLGLDQFLARRKRKITITPIGLEVVHLAEIEPEEITGPILGPRRHCRFSTAYSKPCIFNRPTDLSRGGHYATDDELNVFRKLYLFHMRFADAGLFNRRHAARSAQMDGFAEMGPISGFWKKVEGQETLMDKVARLPVSARFDFDPHVERMHASWASRGDRLFSPAREISEELAVIPERFHGVV